MAKLKIEGQSVTPRQAMMLAVLGAVLIGATYWPTDDAATLDAGPGPVPPAAAARLAAMRAKAEAKPKTWPHVSLDAALAHDPFSSPLLTAQTAAAEADENNAAPPPEESASLLALKQGGVSMIVREGASIVATVGERKLRVGDVIDGYRVVAIEMDGVVLQRVTTE